MPGALSQKNGMLSYYKDPSYFEKKWAPEQIPEESLRALAQAQALAVQKGVLSPALAQKFLANTLVEGYTGGPTTVTADKGVGDDMEDAPDVDKEHVVGKVGVTTPQFGADYLGYDGPDVRKNIQAMGLKVQSGQPKELPPGSIYKGKPVNVFPDGHTHVYASDADLQYSGTGEGQDPAGPRNFKPAAGYLPIRTQDPISNAKIAAIILGKKAALYGEDKAIERWNGMGPDAVRHAQRVAMMQQMLQHPSNAALMNAYQGFLASHMQPQQPPQQLPPQLPPQLKQQQTPYAGVLAQQYLGQ